jgi:hypothetical protein
MGKIYASKVIKRGHHNICVVGESGNYRYVIAGPDGKEIVKSGFPKILAAHTAALRKVRLLSTPT